MKLLRALCSLCALAALSVATPAMAQDPEVKEKAPDKKKAAVVAEISAGGTLSTGNTESWQVGVGNRFQVKKGKHTFEENLALNYGQSDLPGDMVDGFEDTVRNLNAKARYDYNVSEMDALFVGASYRWDTFAGLDARIQANLGYSRNFYKDKDGKHRFWGEAGYDFTYDNLHPDPLPNPTFDNTLPVGPGNLDFLDGDDFVHAARAFIGYDNHISKDVTFLTGAEGLFNVEDGEDVRVNWDNALRASLTGKLQLEVKVSLKFDNQPVPGAEKLDTTTVLNLIYALI